MADIPHCSTMTVLLLLDLHGVICDDNTGAGPAAPDIHGGDNIYFPTMYLPTLLTFTIYTQAYTLPS